MGQGSIGLTDAKLKAMKPPASPSGNKRSGRARLAHSYGCIRRANPPVAYDDPATAFTALRGEVSLLRRAVEGLTAERQNASDYTPTLTGLSSRLARAEELLGKISESPAMRLTPENLAVSIARASETARAGDRETLEKSGATLRASIASINGIVEHAWAADRQWKQLYWTGGGSLLIGALCALSILHLIG